jgi:hypothetical protein
MPGVTFLLCRYAKCRYVVGRGAMYFIHEGNLLS